MQNAGAPAKSGMSVVAIVLVVLGGVALLVVAVLGILFALGAYGARKYVSQAKQSEGRASAMQLASGMALCGSTNAAAGQSDPLPPTSRLVPATLAEIGGKKYMSSPSDWKDPAFECAKFQMSMPQYFQYQWVKRGTDSGAATAISDLDGDGRPDAVFEVTVTCASGSCTAGGVTEKPSP